MKAGELLARQGVVVPERTLHRYALEVLGVGRSARGVAIRVADGKPRSELQVDFGKMGLIVDPATGRRRACWAAMTAAPNGASVRSSTTAVKNYQASPMMQIIESSTHSARRGRRGRTTASHRAADERTHGHRS